MLLPEAPERDLLTTHKSSVIMVEYTTGCNMRCSYCLVSDPRWQIRNLKDRLAERVGPEIIERRPNIVSIHGHGETTMLEGWEEKAQQFIDAGLDVSICTNLAKQYTEQEFEVLSKLRHLTVSLDTVDVKLFKKLRRGGDIRHVIYNLTRIQSYARMRDEELHISWSIVVCDKSVWGLVDLVKYGISLGVKGFTFCNLGEIDTPPKALATEHVSNLSQEDCRRALKRFDRITQLCEKYGCELDLKVGIIDTLTAKAETGSTNWTNVVNL